MIAARAFTWLAVLAALLFAVPGLAIVCGKSIDPDEHPWLVGIERRSAPVPIGGAMWCTGTLLAPDVVITAAHCLRDENVALPAGELLATRGGGIHAVVIGSKVISLPPQMAPAESDVVVLRLSAPLGNPDAVFPELAVVTPDVPEVEMVGWGTFKPGTSDQKLSQTEKCPGHAGPNPRLAPAMIHDGTVCPLSKSLKRPQDPAYWLCVHGQSPQTKSPQTKEQKPKPQMIFEELSAGACNGDSGSPLLVRRNDAVPLLIGVESAVMNVRDDRPWTSCARNPALYSAVAPIRDAIENAIALLERVVSTPTPPLQSQR